MTGPRRRRLSTPLLAACALWAGLGAEAAAQGSAASDRAVLEALYDATGGPDWIDDMNWKTAAPLGEWFGVTTDTAGRVTWLELRGNGLAGPISAALGELALLRNLSLGSRWDSAAQEFIQNTLTARYSWTDRVLRAGVTRVRRVHVLELRSALAEAYAASGQAVPRWTDASPPAGTTPIRAAHVTELRAAVLALE